MRKMIDRTEELFGLKPDWIAAETAYGSSDNLVWLTLKRKILPFIPVFDKGERPDGTYASVRLLQQYAYANFGPDVIKLVWDMVAFTFSKRKSIRQGERQGLPPIVSETIMAEAEYTASKMSQYIYFNGLRKI